MILLFRVKLKIPESIIEATKLLNESVKTYNQKYDLLKKEFSTANFAFSDLEIQINNLGIQLDDPKFQQEAPEIQETTCEIQKQVDVLTNRLDSLKVISDGVTSKRKDHDGITEYALKLIDWSIQTYSSVPDYKTPDMWTKVMFDKFKVTLKQNSVGNQKRMADLETRLELLSSSLNAVTAKFRAITTLQSC